MFDFFFCLTFSVQLFSGWLFFCLTLFHIESTTSRQTRQHINNLLRKVIWNFMMRKNTFFHVWIRQKKNIRKQHKPNEKIIINYCWRDSMEDRLGWSKNHQHEIEFEFFFNSPPSRIEIYHFWSVKYCLEFKISRLKSKILLEVKNGKCKWAINRLLMLSYILASEEYKHVRSYFSKLLITPNQSCLVFFMHNLNKLRKIQSKPKWQKNACGKW